MNQLEIACFSLDAIAIAQENGADRIELCLDRAAGGITPPAEMVQAARALTTVALHVMIRPREGDFVYTETEFQAMKNSITTFKNLGVDGFVFGILHPDGSIHSEANAALVHLAHPLPCTFHRAFDGIVNPLQGLATLVACGFKTVLTSGVRTNVTEGAELLQQLVAHASDRITVMPGGGLRSSNARWLSQTTRAVYYHSAAITDHSELPNPTEVALLKQQLNTL